ncbi:hypothetical protein FM104_14110 [Microbacterium esteraromaticum]|uniref:Uncharacterized protein n=1 Tax=Microbacterium esteraromaticum TaxID=57043 RepID=A0A1R4KML4_9MICO|nr:hypothetical protein FM104_14110 [Microbacterium esteraromaticum]
MHNERPRSRRARVALRRKLDPAPESVRRPERKERTMNAIFVVSTAADLLLAEATRF